MYEKKKTREEKHDLLGLSRCFQTDDRPERQKKRRWKGSTKTGVTEESLSLTLQRHYQRGKRARKSMGALVKGPGPGAGGWKKKGRTERERPRFHRKTFSSRSSRASEDNTEYLGKV